MPVLKDIESTHMADDEHGSTAEATEPKYDFARMWEKERVREHDDYANETMPDLLRMATVKYRKAYGDDLAVNPLTATLLLSNGFDTVSLVLMINVNFPEYEGEEQPDTDKVP